MIPFIERTWLVWWIVAIVFATRWFHVLSNRSVEDFDVLISEEEAEIASVRFQTIQADYLPSQKRAFGKLSSIYGIVYDLRSGKLIGAEVREKYVRER